MIRTVLLAMVLTGLAGASARAGDADLCDGLKAAWTAAKSDPRSVKDVKLPGADKCSFSDNDLRCFWTFEGPGKARRTYDGFKSVATACFAPLGFAAIHKVLSGVETTSLEPRNSEEPDVAIFYPPGGSVVGISIVTAD